MIYVFYSSHIPIKSRVLPHRGKTDRRIRHRICLSGCLPLWNLIHNVTLHVAIGEINTSYYCLLQSTTPSAWAWLLPNACDSKPPAWQMDAPRMGDLRRMPKTWQVCGKVGYTEWAHESWLAPWTGVLYILTCIQLFNYSLLKSSAFARRYYIECSRTLPTVALLVLSCLQPSSWARRLAASWAMTHY